jgi:Zn-dependent M28 family amino/carboxypeptidase
MRKTNKLLFIACILVSLPIIGYSQKITSSLNLITASDLESHVSFLASPLLKGRMNGQEGLEIAAKYIATQAKLTGLKPANGKSYFQPYLITEKEMDPEKTMVQIISGKRDTITIKDPIFQLIPTGPSDFTLEGEVVFAGYGIKADKYKYNDFKNIKTEGRILLVMDRAPMYEDSDSCQFEAPGWTSEMNFQMKLTTLILTKPKAILIVNDPKSGFRSFSESSPGFAAYIKSTFFLNGEREEVFSPLMAGMPKIIFINRSVADALLSGSGHSLDELQRGIDSSLTPNSFLLTNTQLKITEVSLKREKTLNNVAAYIEGSDPILKNEFIIFSSHYDHIGGFGNYINTGADDDASGCAALLSMAKAFQNLDKKPLRSILFLWVSGEEIGLYGSKMYVNKPLFPIENTVVNINLDMIGRVKGIADSTSDNPMTGPNTVFAITAKQSKDLLSIADNIDNKSPLDFDYSLSGKSHPLQLFARSDHYSFVEKDVPVLFFTTGLHTDYHSPRDVVEKLDFDKMELISRTIFELGYTIANRKTRLVVDYPFSSW